MKLTYKELEIELELAGLLAVEELVLTQRLNCHAGLTLKILIEEEQRDELVTMSSDAGVTVRELEKTNGRWFSGESWRRFLPEGRTDFFTYTWKPGLTRWTGTA